MLKPVNYQFVISVVFILFLFFINNNAFTQSDPKPVFSFLTPDSIYLDVSIINDTGGTPEYYIALVKGPVCKDGKCHPVELFMYWDLIGNYIKYQTKIEFPLERGYQIYFDESDYEKLHKLLKTKWPSFYYLKKEDLVAKVVEDSLDGISGATVSAVKNETVAGAAYTCYTLWHIANGIVKDSIQAHTKTRINKSLVKKLVRSEDIESQFFLIEAFSGEDWNIYLDEIMTLISKNTAYLAKNTIEKMPDDLFKRNNVQNFFVGYYDDMNYFARLSLVKRLQGKTINRNLKKVLLANQTSQNSLLNELVEKL